MRSDTEKRRTQNREAQRAYREKMHAAELHEITVWATLGQAKVIKEFLARRKPDQEEESWRGLR